MPVQLFLTFQHSCQLFENIIHNYCEFCNPPLAPRKRLPSDENVYFRKVNIIFTKFVSLLFSVIVNIFHTGRFVYWQNLEYMISNLLLEQLFHVEQFIFDIISSRGQIVQQQQPRFTQTELCRISRTNVPRGTFSFWGRRTAREVAPRFSGRAVKEQRLRRLWLRCLTAGADNICA